jgi:PKD repeat protein
VVVDEPCTPPKVSYTVYEVNRQDATHELRGSVSGVENKSGISLTLDGRASSGFQFNSTTGLLDAKFKLAPGSHTMVVVVSNACGSDNQGTTVTVESPCTPPSVAFTVTEVNRQDASHELRGSVTSVKNKASISLILDGRPNSGFQFVPATGDLSAKFKLAAGSHTIAVTANNECGSDSESKTVTVQKEEEEKEEACGIRINPGNSDWQFCLITPSGRFSRANLTNSNFSYSGPASSIFFMPIGGGGNATVNGRPYAVKSGQYYLFTGSLNVKVSTKNPGALGQWSVCITASRAPVSGNGNNRPKSPCEEVRDTPVRGNSNRR